MPDTAFHGPLIRIRPGESGWVVFRADNGLLHRVIRHEFRGAEGYTFTELVKRIIEEELYRHEIFMEERHGSLKLPIEYFPLSAQHIRFLDQDPRVIQ